MIPYISIVEHYIGRELKPQELILRKTETSFEIDYWGIPEKPQPTKTQINNYWTNNKLVIMKMVKKKLLYQKLYNRLIQKYIKAQPEYTNIDTQIDIASTVNDLNAIII